jgi:predicted phosphodiesterase
MYAEIIEEVKRAPPPDLVFLTGDLAFAGSDAEYRSLEAIFIKPLKEVLPADCPLFTVPGNHDLDRERGTKPRLWVVDPEERKLFQAVDASGARGWKDTLLLAFKHMQFSDFLVGKEPVGVRRLSVWGQGGQRE